jgi:hypothetical protein
MHALKRSGYLRHRKYGFSYIRLPDLQAGSETRKEKRILHLSPFLFSGQAPAGHSHISKWLHKTDLCPLSGQKRLPKVFGKTDAAAP